MSQDIAILSVHRERGPENINYKNLIRDLGMQFSAFPMDGSTCGYMEPLERHCFKVCINSDQTEEEQRLTSARIVSHFLLHRDLITSIHYEYNESRDVTGGLTLEHESQASKLAHTLINGNPQKVIGK